MPYHVFAWRSYLGYPGTIKNTSCIPSTWFTQSPISFVVTSSPCDDGTTPIAAVGFLLVGLI